MIRSRGGRTTFFKKKRSVSDILAELKNPETMRDDARVAACLEELRAARKRADPREVENAIGWTILCACEARLPCTSKYLPLFLQEYPGSLMPVCIEYAMYLAEGACNPDEATEVCRQYLRRLSEAGLLSPALTENPVIRRGASKAWLILTAATTHCGARSWSKRLLQFALRFDIEPQVLGKMREELERLDEELADSQNKQIDERWEMFCAKGAGVRELMTHCTRARCPQLARRVELLEGRFFRFSINGEGKLPEDEPLLLVQRFMTGDRKEIYGLA